MNNSHTLKGLESQLARLESDLATCKSIIRGKEYRTQRNSKEH